MAVNLSPIGGVAGQFFDNNGNPLVGGKLFTYAAGTTTPQVTFTSALGNVPNSNPIILNGGGRVPAEIWLTDGLEYKFVLYSSTDQLIGAWDNITGINSNFVNFVTSEEVQTATAGQTVFTLTTMQYAPSTNNLVVYVDGVNQIEGGAFSFVETGPTIVTFTTGLHVGALVKFVSAETLSTGVSNAANVVYDPAGTGAVTTNVQTKLRESVSVKDFGAVGDGVTDDTVAFNNAISFLPLSGGVIFVPPGNYNVTVVSLTVGNKVVNWVANNGVTLPNDMPGLVTQTGIFNVSLDKDVSQNVKIQNYYEAGDIATSADYFQWANHVEGFLPDTGVTSGDREFRAFSFDLGTNTSYGNEDIRGLKGRVYADGGNGNVRAIYGYAEGFNGHNGQLTGLIGTATRHAGATSFTAAIRGHINGSVSDLDCTIFSAAGNGGEAAPGYAYLVRGGTDAINAVEADFCTHGSGSGLAFLLYKDKTNRDKAQAPFTLTKKGLVKNAAIYSGSSTVADDAFIQIEPPAFSGFIEVWCDTTSQTWGKIYFRAFEGSPSPALAEIAYGGTLFAATTGPLTGTTGADTKLTVSADNTSRRIFVENRTGDTRDVNWQFVCAP